MKKDNKLVRYTFRDTIRRKCVDCKTIFESQGIVCPNCKSKKTTCAFVEKEGMK